jgi:hypothetical protein
MKYRTSTVIHGVVAIAIGLMLAQTSDAQIAQNAGWCCVNGKLQQLNQPLCARHGGRYFDNAEEARRACGQTTPAAPTAPSPIPPSVTIGFCCLDGELLSLPLSECQNRHGRHYNDREEAENDCRREGPPERPLERRGVCCLDGELVPMPEPECRERDGRFFERPEDAERLCRREGPPERPLEIRGVCCLDDEMHPMPEMECHDHGGRFFERPEDAKRLCRRERPPERPLGIRGVCCLDGEPVPMPEMECHDRGGRFFERPEDAERLCRREGPPERPLEIRGVCCLDDEMHPMPEMECHDRGGRFFERPEDAERFCRRERPPERPLGIRGVCCLDGEPVPMPEMECHDRGGRFFERPEDAERLCRREGPPERPLEIRGICCLDGEPVPMPEPECRERDGRFFERPEDAERLCRREGPPERPLEIRGVCCLDGEPRPMREDECRELSGRFFERFEEAARQCRSDRSPKAGWCCPKKSYPSEELECTQHGGVFFKSESEARAYCNEIPATVGRGPRSERLFQPSTSDVVQTGPKAGAALIVEVPSVEGMGWCLQDNQAILSRRAECAQSNGTYFDDPEKAFHAYGLESRPMANLPEVAQGCDATKITTVKLATIKPPPLLARELEMTKQSISQKYLELGGKSGILGAAIAQPQVAAKNGKFQEYEHGRMYWHPHIGAYSVRGPIKDKWDSYHAEKGFLGYPVSDEIKAPDCIGVYQVFQGGVILWTMKTGAHELHGEVLQKYKDLGAYDSVLGYPTTDTYGTPCSNYLLYANFFHPKTNVHGTIWWTAEYGAHEIHGEIWKKWNALGFTGTGCPNAGDPTTDETRTPNGKGRYNHFSGGSIYWTPATGAHFVDGAILKKWEQLKWEKGLMGFPKTDGASTPDGKGSYVHFENGSIYWSSSTGAHEVHGEILKKWAQLGWEQSFLGFPTIDVQNAPDDNGRYSNFEGGGIVWYPASGAKARHWYGKDFRIYFGESIFVDGSNTSDLARDMDGDRLKDDLEGKLAQAFRPYFKFDSSESARRSFEPVTIFQVRPKGYVGAGDKSKTNILVRWGFLFEWDGGYGPDSSLCTDDHHGDNERATYTFSSPDNGFTWKLDAVQLGGSSFRWPEWPQAKMSVYHHSTSAILSLQKASADPFKQYHPVIHMSAHKHHMYFDTAYDHKASFYSDPIWGCHDDVNGNGVGILANLYSVFGKPKYNNVGEPEKHHKQYFVNCMPQFAPGSGGDTECNGVYYSAWGASFYDVTGNAGLWMQPQDCAFTTQ